MEKINNILLVISLTSLLCPIVCNPTRFDDVDDDVGILPFVGREFIEAMLRRQGGILSQHDGNSVDGIRSAARPTTDDDDGKGEIRGSSEVIHGYEGSPWRRFVAKILREADDRNDKPDTYLTGRRKRFCCSIDMYCFICNH